MADDTGSEGTGPDAGDAAGGADAGGEAEEAITLDSLFAPVPDLLDDDERSAMDHDPFAAKDTADEDEPKGEPKDEPKDKLVAQAADKTKEDKVDDPKDEPNAEMETIKAQLALAQSQITQLSESAAQTSAATTQAAKDTEAVEAAKAKPDPYDFDIKDSLLDKITSENSDDVRQGLYSLARGVAQTVHNNVMAEMRKEFIEGDALKANVSSQVTSLVETQNLRERVRTDFYGKFPQFNSPQFEPLVGMAMKQVGVELGATDWSDKLRDAVGERVISWFPTMAVSTDPPKDESKTVPKATPLTKGGSRPTAPTDKNSVAAQIDELRAFG